MEEPWIIYLEELRERGEEIPYQQFNREDDMREVAHEAYEATADRLFSQMDFNEEEALRITKSFMRVVKDWISDGTMDWDDLEEELELAQEEWDSEMGPSLA